jgi:hypothetical protein
MAYRGPGDYGRGDGYEGHPMQDLNIQNQVSSTPLCLCASV